MYRANVPVNMFGNMEKATCGRTRCGKKNGQARRSFDLVPKMLGLWETESGTRTDEPLQTGEGGHDGKMLKRIQVLEDGRIPAKEARNWKIEGQKRRITRKEYRKLWNEFETGHPTRDLFIDDYHLQMRSSNVEVESGGTLCGGSLIIPVGVAVPTAAHPRVDVRLSTGCLRGGGKKHDQRGSVHATLTSTKQSSRWPLGDRTHR